MLAQVPQSLLRRLSRRREAGLLAKVNHRVDNLGAARVCSSAARDQNDSTPFGRIPIPEGAAEPFSEEPFCAIAANGTANLAARDHRTLES